MREAASEIMMLDRRHKAFFCVIERSAVTSCIAALQLISQCTILAIGIASQPAADQDKQLHLSLPAALTT